MTPRRRNTPGSVTRKYPNPRLDVTFRKVFGEEPNIRILTSLIESVLSHYSDHPIKKKIRIIDPHSLNMTISGRIYIMDVKAVDELGQHFDIEMQRADPGDYEQRMVAYMSILFLGQAAKGSDCSGMKKVISIHILGYNMYGDDGPYHLVHYFTAETRGRTITVYEVHTIELLKFRKTQNQLDCKMDFWVYYLKNIDKHNIENPPQAFKKHPVLLAACLTLKGIYLNENDMKTYKKELKEMDNLKNMLKANRKKCLQEGELKGQHELLLKQIRYKFGNISAKDASMIERLTHEQILALSEAIFEAQSFQELLQIGGCGNNMSRTSPTRISPRKRVRTEIAV
jgi:predicted transposase/invertase (TIGR01784 family)